MSEFEGADVFFTNQSLEELFKIYDYQPPSGKKLEYYHVPGDDTLFPIGTDLNLIAESLYGGHDPETWEAISKEQALEKLKIKLGTEPRRVVGAVGTDPYAVSEGVPDLAETFVVKKK